MGMQLPDDKEEHNWDRGVCSAHGLHSSLQLKTTRSDENAALAGSENYIFQLPENVGYLRSSIMCFHGSKVEDLEKQLDHEAELPNEAANQQTEGDGEAAKEDCGSGLPVAHRAPWLRALVLGANDGLVSIASLLLGVSAGNSNERSIILSGIAGLIAGACSMAVGEFVSVSSQRDTEVAEIERERRQHAAGGDAAARELEELAQIYVTRGLTPELAREVAAQLSRDGQDVVKVHAREELGIDVDALARPWQAAAVSAVAFTTGGAVPLLAAGFVEAYRWRLAAIGLSTSMGLAAFGACGARLGKAPILAASTRVTVGGWIAMLATFGILYLVSRNHQKGDLDFS
ncbi:vacuolar iron transporter homolog 2-like [Selaginella moellendorffii]|uniref:vacuolar iron transporter homolog 2-like n=1 Tax=Selaginella moellendorffii TaxID=88036 RepID=UPI000D1C58A1|nr:vacuolar iron transporter homolog 2-like [Selaginella moellendorffii]|eukprot:XP_024522499.1 vacuolar iron transporter homolog 2-like [Selaginella moellendorffii]